MTDRDAAIAALRDEVAPLSYFDESEAMVRELEANALERQMSGSWVDLASPEAAEGLARALKHLAFGGGSDAVHDDEPFDVGYLSYSGDATVASLTAAILAAWQQERLTAAESRPDPFVCSTCGQGLNASIYGHSLTAGHPVNGVRCPTCGCIGHHTRTCESRPDPVTPEPDHAGMSVDER